MIAADPGDDAGLCRPCSTALTTPVVMALEARRCRYGGPS